jgi:predicted aspartyl protease
MEATMQNGTPTKLTQNNPLTEKDSYPTLEIAHTTLAGTAKSAPYVDVAISVNRNGMPPKSELTFKARIDTGADASCVPKEIAKKLMTLQCKRNLRIRLHDGRISRERTFLLAIEIIGFKPEHASIYRPPDGVLLRASPEGLIGMDILKYLHLEMCNEKTVLRLPKGGGE